MWNAFFYCKWMAARNIVTTKHSLLPLPWFVHSSFIHHCFWTIIVNVNTVEKGINIIIKNSLSSWALWKLTTLRNAALTKYFSVADFESFDLPEEHQIAHMPLNGVPLMILDEERELEQLLHLGPPSPLKMPPPPWESSKWMSALLEGL